MSGKIIWVDCETSGLNPLTDSILEVAAIATDGDLVELARFHAVVPVRDHVLLDMNPDARAMHEANGLLAEVRAAARGTFDDFLTVEDRFMRWVRATFPNWRPGELTLAGNSVWFDKAFIRSYWKEADAVFNRRLLDASAFKVAWKECFGREVPKRESPHRAMADVEASIEEFRLYRDAIRRALDGELRVLVSNNNAEVA